MLSKICTAALNGLESQMVTVETDISAGIPSLNLVGLPTMMVRESRERVRSALINNGYIFPAKRVTINLSPANTRKEGNHFDLPIALGIINALGFIGEDKLKQTGFLGELSLDGKINKISGALALAIGLRENGIVKIFLPAENLKEVSIVLGVKFYPVKSLGQIINFFEKGETVEFCSENTKLRIEEKGEFLDYDQVVGQELAKRALTISAAGSHNLIMVGPPGAGKTMLAMRITTILPKLSYEDMLEVTKIYSISGELSESMPIIEQRPFRYPHHSISGAGLIGGGVKARPGEISLAHNGVLFLDELPQFNPSTLALLRQPLEDRKIIITRGGASLAFPSNFILIGAMNPCPCGYLGSVSKSCICTKDQINRYYGRLSGPLIDRIDMYIDVLQVEPYELETINISENNRFSNMNPWKNSSSMSTEVKKAVEIQRERYRGTEIKRNAQLVGESIKKYCNMTAGSKKIMRDALKRFSLSGRGSTKLIKLARTIADLEGSDKIRDVHMAEAVRYRRSNYFNK